MLFPHSFRPFQREAAEKIADAVNGGRAFLFQAPTGFGKTPVVLSALLPLEKRILWITRTGNEADRPIEELGKINKKFDLRFSGVSFRGKRDMCPLARENGAVDHDAVSSFCDECPLKKESLPLEGAVTFSEIYRIAGERGVCPYKLQQETASQAKVVSLSYNYVLTDLVHFLKTMIEPEDSVLVVDEAHNMQHAAGEMNSARLSRKMIESAVKEARTLPDPRMVPLSLSMKRLLPGLGLIGEEEERDPEKILESAGLTLDDMEFLGEKSSEVYERQKRQGKPLRSFLRSLAKFWTVSVSSKGKDGTIFLAGREGYEFVDMRVNEILSPLWKKFSASVLMSGTLKPTKSFAELVGLSEYGVMEVPSFSASVHPFLVSGVNTSGTSLSEQNKKRYEFLIDSFLSYPGNSAIFTASYRIQSELMNVISSIAKSRGRVLFAEESSIAGDEAAEVLKKFKETDRAVLVAPMGGRFAEGADFPGGALQAIMLVGVPFERFSLRAKRKISYYEKAYGEKGRFLSYELPAIKRASQALGRAIRSPQDFGLFLLADERYARYTELLPDYIERNLQSVHYSNVPLVLRNFSGNEL
jgi:DNA excision repair protein ERCC-2